MRKTLVTLTAALCLGAPAAALAADATAPSTPSASQACKTLRTQLGSSVFAATYGTTKNGKNAYGKCVSKATKAQDAQERTAKSACKAERDDPNFAAAHSDKTFAQFYGTNKNGKNAYGKCVSGKAKAAADADRAAVVSAAKACKSERAQDPAAFKQRYGTNKNKSNAFGKCVSKAAKADQTTS